MRACGCVCADKIEISNSAARFDFEIGGHRIQIVTDQIKWCSAISTVYNATNVDYWLWNSNVTDIELTGRKEMKPCNLFSQMRELAGRREQVLHINIKRSIYYLQNANVLRHANIMHTLTQGHKTPHTLRLSHLNENMIERNTFRAMGERQRERENSQLESLSTILTECIFRQRRITETCMQSLNHTAIHNTAQQNAITRKLYT